MKMTALIAMVMATALMVSTASPQEAGVAGGNKQEASAKRIKELQKERIATLEGMMDGATRLAKRGSHSIEEACDAWLLLVRAQVDAAEADSDRIKFYETYVAAMQQFEEMARAQLEAARGTKVTVLRAKANRLEAEIAIERLKAK
jgi:hypothetical protein